MAVLIKCDNEKDYANPIRKIENIYCSNEELRVHNPQIIVDCVECEDLLGIPLKVLVSNYDIKCQNGHIMEEGFKKVLLDKLYKEREKRVRNR